MLNRETSYSMIAGLLNLASYLLIFGESFLICFYCSLFSQSVKDMPIVQDGPPPGGFPAIRYARRVPSTGPAGITLFAVGGIVMAYGFYKVGQGNHARRAEGEEKMQARKALVPFLQAEEDRR